MRYPARFEPAPEGGFVVTFRDVPEAITQGDSDEAAMAMAADVLLSSMDFYFEDRRAVPAPSKLQAGERLVELPPSVSAKILLLNALVGAAISNAELARRMGTSPQALQRVLDLHHATKIDTIAAALLAIGHRLEVRLV